MRRTNLLLAAAAGGCAGMPALRVDPSRDVGVARQVSDSVACVVMPRAGLPVGATVYLVATAAPGAGISPRILEAEILETGISAEGCPEPVGPTSDARYRVRMAASEPLGPLFAVSGPRDALRVTSESVALLRERGGDAAIFRLCTSTEGVHLTLWGGEPLRSRRLFHRYVPLGMDVEPTCTEPDWAGSEGG